MAVVKYEHFIGYKLFRLHDYFLRSIGVLLIPENGYENTKLVILTRYFANLLVLMVCVQGVATFFAAYDCLMAEDYIAVSNVMAYLSVTLSSLSKYQIVRMHSKEIFRLSEWATAAKSERVDASIPQIEVLVLKVNKSFYCFGMFASAFWGLVPFTRHLVPLIPSKLPYLDDEIVDAIAFPYVQLPCNMFLTSTIVFTATGVLHILAVFCSEVRFHAKKWYLVKYDEARPGAYLTSMKECINGHLKLLKVMKDLNTIHDSMFAFQVIIFIVHFCSFNFCLLKTEGSEAVAALFPLTMSSMMEFGLLCWMGEEITHALQQLHKNVYMTNWYIAPPAVRSNMVIVQEVLKKPHYLTGASVFQASLNTFVETLRQAFSLYTLMKALTSKE